MTATTERAFATDFRSIRWSDHRRDGKEPDWSLYARLELGGCVSGRDEDGGEWVEGGLDATEAGFFSIYGRLKAGPADCLVDCKTLMDAERVLEGMCGRSGLCPLLLV